MKELRKEYEVTLRTMAPVHIGSGKTYTQKEFVYENGSYYFPDMGLLYQEIKRNGTKAVETFEYFLMESGNQHNRQKPRLINFLREQKMISRSFGGYSIKETGDEEAKDRRDVKGQLNEVAAFIKDSYGLPYIPGSSLKGAIRTVLVNEHFYSDQISWGAKKGKPFSDVFHNIRVSDSEPLSTDDLMLAQKWDFSLKKKEAKPLPIHRESLKPFTIVEFTITAIGEEAVTLMDQLGKLAIKHYKAYEQYFLSEFPPQYVQKNIQYPLYLGAGSGFWTKTYMKEADTSKFQNGKMKMQGKGVLKLTKCPNKKFKVKGDVRTLVDNPHHFYEMGKCNFLIKPK